MVFHTVTLAGCRLHALAEGALWWPDAAVLTVGDLHLGRAERMARTGRGLLPPYESMDTLDRLDAILAVHPVRRLVCLGDSFDDLDAAQTLGEAVHTRLWRLAAGREVIWVAGNHDPGPVDLPGTHLPEYREGALVFRHIARPDATGEISGHYHPKLRLTARGQHVSRPCFLVDRSRLILPAFGTYTGGLDIRDPAFDAVLATDAVAITTGPRMAALPRAGLG